MALYDIGPDGALAGRSAAHLHGLDGFAAVDPIELLVQRRRRNVATSHVVRSTTAAFVPGDLVTVDGLRCLGAERLIVEAPRFGFASSEIERAIDSAIRRRLVDESRLRRRAELWRSRRDPGQRLLRAALSDTGGESHLERRFLTLLRAGGLPRPKLRRTVRSGGRTIARLDALFGDDLVVELEGHATPPTPAVSNAVTTSSGAPNSRSPGSGC